jgi:hypothetical protein
MKRIYDPVTCPVKYMLRKYVFDEILLSTQPVGGSGAACALAVAYCIAACAGCAPCARSRRASPRHTPAPEAELHIS